MPRLYEDYLALVNLDALEDVGLQRVDGVEEGLPAPVHAMVAGPGDHIESGVLDGGGGLFIGLHRQPRLRHTGATPGQVDLELAERQIGTLDQVPDRIEDRFGVIPIGGHIADSH